MSERHDLKAGIKVFLSAYACEPNKGSEPGVGWAWTNGLAEKVTLTVLTRSNSQELIQEAMRENSKLNSVYFIYYDLPRIFIWLKSKGLLPTFLYYVIWQYFASYKFHSVAEDHDVTHHLTFCSLLCPGFWRVKKAKSVIGPVGAPLVSPYYLKLFGSKASTQAFRNWLLEHFTLIPWLKSRYGRTHAIVPANTETRRLLQNCGFTPKKVILDTGAPSHGKIRNYNRLKSTGCQFVYAGQLEIRKGLSLAIKAFGLACENKDFGGQFTIIGEGPQQAELMSLVKDLDLEDRVFFAGRIPQSEVYERFSVSDVFVFCSVRDTSGGVNLEAMSLGLPVICINHQGVADIVNPDCSLQVEPGEIEETICGLSDKMLKVDKDPNLLSKMSEEASRRAREDFSWEEKFRTMVDHYHDILAFRS